MIPRTAKALLALLLAALSLASAQLPSLPQARVRGLDQNPVGLACPEGELSRAAHRAWGDSWSRIASDYAFGPNSGTSSGSPTGQIWTSPAPTGPKPRIGEPGAAEWRYQRYLHEQSANGKSPAEVLSRDEWIERYFNPTASGGRPGRSGGPEQVAAKRVLQAEGIRIVENVQLGARYPDGISPRPNALGGTDYFEVGRMLDNGLPEARERVKLVDELRALHPNDTVTFVDRSNPAKRITDRVDDLARLLATLRRRK